MINGISDTALIYAAGLGTRMGALTRELPKPLLKVAGRTLLDRSLDVVVQAGFARVVVNVHYCASMIVEHVQARSDIEIIISDESQQLLETGGGLKKALPNFEAKTVFVLNSDTFWQGDNPATELLQAWKPQRMDALLALMPTARMSDPQRSGDFSMDQNGILHWPSETLAAPFLYTGAQIIKTEEFKNWPEAKFSTFAIWQKLIAAQRCRGMVYGGQWVDVGRPEALLEAEALAQHG